MAAFDRRTHVTWSGLLGVSYDVIALFLVPISWYAGVGGPEAVSGAFLAKTDIAFIGLVLVAINSLALRPLYPLIVTVALFVFHIAVFLFA